MRCTPTRALFAGAVTIVVIATATDANAVGTRTFVLDTLEKLSGGDLKGVAVSSDGGVRAGFTLGASPITDATATFSAVLLADGSLLTGTSPHGKVYRTTGDATTLFADTGALAVTSIVQTKNGSLYAATIPDGKIFRISQGKADAFVTLPDTSHVWALAVDRAGTGLFAATGPEGKVFRIEPNGTASVYFRSTETHLVSLAVADNGDLLAGSSGKGHLFRITGPGRASVLADLAGEEVKAVASARGYVWAIANEYGEPPEPPKRSPAAGRTPAGPTTGARPKPGKGALYRFDAQGRVERMMKHDDTHYMSLALDDQGRPYVGTGVEGRVYTVDDAHVVTLVADTDERQVGALAISGAAKGFIATSDPPVAHRILGRGGADAVWTSKVLDASLRARFGTLTWRATGAVELSTRTGNTSSPDGTWSAWSADLPAAGPITSAQGRYIQVRARWARDPNAILHEVTIPFVTENVRPVVTEISATSKAGVTKEPAAAVPASGGDTPKHDSVVKVTWKVENPDNDPLRYRVSFRREGQSLWRDALRADDVLTKPEFDWDTAALPEGKYRVRVEASDEIANPPDQVQRHTLESDPVLVDNTPPRIDALQLTGRRLKCRVIDGTSPIARVEIAVDGKLEWRPLGAADGIFDTLDEGVDADIAALVSPGSHVVVVRAFDVAGNAVTRDVEAR